VARRHLKEMTMAAPASAISHFQALPFPARLAIGFFGLMAVAWLTRWLGGTLVPVAILLWCAVGLGVWRADRGLAWADRYPRITRALDHFAPRLVVRLTPTPSATASSQAESGSADDVSTEPSGETPAGSSASGTYVAPDLSRFVGLDDVFAEINQLVTARAGRIATLAPATLVLLIGPRGTGKSSVARVLAAELGAAGALETGRIVPLGSLEIPGLAGAYGPSDAATSDLSDRIQASVDGVLLIDDLDWLAGAAGGPAATEFGNRLLAVAHRYPRRLFVIGTGSAAAASRLDPGNRWLGQLHVRRIDFPPLSVAALRNIFLRLLDEKGLSLAAGAERAVDIQIGERRTQAGDNFDNAHAARRLVDDVLHSHGLRVHNDKTLPAEERDIVTADDVRNAMPTV
jgi:hypothetical protein